MANDRATLDEFGWSVAISGDHVIVGARYEDHDAMGGGELDNSGSAYIFVRNGDSWDAASQAAQPPTGISLTGSAGASRSAGINAHRGCSLRE